MEHIQRLRRDHDMTFLFVEHDMDVVMNHADHVVVMASGRVIAADAPHVVRDDPGVIDAYLGTHHGGAGGNR
jgi:branched-chain amino acid transport system ATP-binding protein